MSGEGIFIIIVSLLVIYFILAWKVFQLQWAKTHIPWGFRRWISKDGFDQGFNRGFGAMNQGMEDRKRDKRKKRRD